MKIMKCIIYAIIIAVLIFVLIKSVNMLKENFESIETTDSSNTIKTNDTTSIIDSAKNIVDNVKNSDIVTSVVNTVKDTLQNNNIIENTKTLLTDEIVNPILNNVSSSEQSIHDNYPILEEPAIVTTNEEPTIVTTNEEPTVVTTMEEQQKDIPIIPKYVDSVSKTIADGTKFIPQSTLSPWANGYMGNNVDSSFMINLGGNDLDQGSGRFSRRSPSCCSSQYPLPFKLKVDNEVCLNKDKYVPNPYMGNDNWTNAGCMCMTKDNMIQLATRGGNA